MNTIPEIAAVLRSLKSAVIFTHMRPDGDAVGSGIALSRALDLLNIPNQLVNEGELPQKFRFLAGAEKFLLRPTLDAEGYICVDSSDERRLGELCKLFLKGAGKGKVTVNLDHHISNTRYCKYNFVRCRSSNCENIAELIEELGVPKDEIISSALMTGIITDSGSFSHSDVNGDTFRAAAQAADGGAKVDRITNELFRRQSKARSELYLGVLPTSSSAARARRAPSSISAFFPACAIFSMTSSPSPSSRWKRFSRAGSRSRIPRASSITPSPSTPSR